MPKYDAKNLEKQFRSAASLRIRKKARGNDEYAGDATYWDGGRCNWGGSHNLTEDCETISKGFDGIDELKSTKKTLTSCTSKAEFDSNKSRLLRKVETIENGAQIRTGSASSMFGVCCIWADYNDFLESKLKVLRDEISRLKGEINKSEYKYLEEIRALKLEQKQIEQRMKENKQKAAKEKDQAKKAILLQLIEEDGKRLEENLRKQKVIPTVNLSFDPDKYVADLIEAMKKAATGESRGNNNRAPRNPRTSTNTNNSNHNNFGSEDDIPDSDPTNSNQSRSNPSTPQTNNQLFIYGVIALIVIYFLMNQRENHDY